MGYSDITQQKCWKAGEKLPRFSKSLWIIRVKVKKKKKLTYSLCLVWAVDSLCVLFSPIHLPVWYMACQHRGLVIFAENAQLALSPPLFKIHRITHIKAYTRFYAQTRCWGGIIRAQATLHTSLHTHTDHSASIGTGQKKINILKSGGIFKKRGRWPTQKSWKV